jgi:hypothetical protein
MSLQNFFTNRDTLQQEGVYIGGWSLKYTLTPQRGIDGKHDSVEDHINASDLTEIDWTEAEERALVRKLDLRVLFPACIIYFLAYLGSYHLELELLIFC